MTLYNSVVGEFSIMSMHNNNNNYIIIMDNMFIIILLWYSCMHTVPILHNYSV